MKRSKTIDFIFVMTAIGAALATAGLYQRELNSERQRHRALAQEHSLLGTRLQASERLSALLECEVERLKPVRKVTGIVVHHSESPFGDVPTVDAWHRERGFSQIGYHYLICNGQGGLDGEIQFGRDEDVQGAHAKANFRNEGTLGVCLVGTDQFTTAQKKSLQELLLHLCRRHGLTPGPQTIQRHHEQCPGTAFDLAGIIAGVQGHLARN
ncbi:MAG: peptidoglycan recognition family protein [bacterium]|nr:peptidoglycan recognition family protein [bacterium]